MNKGGPRDRFSLKRSTLSQGVFAGFDGTDQNKGCKEWYEDSEWCYAGPVVMTGVKTGISTVRVRLRCPFVAQQFIKEPTE